MGSYRCLQNMRRVLCHGCSILAPQPIIVPERSVLRRSSSAVCSGHLLALSILSCPVTAFLVRARVLTPVSRLTFTKLPRSLVCIPCFDRINDNPR